MTCMILLTRHAFERWWPLIAQAAPASTAVVAEPGGTVTLAQAGTGAAPGPGAGGSLSADIAWITADVWEPPETELFAHILAARGLTWCHTTAAGTDGELYETLRRRQVVVTNSHCNADAVADFVLRAGLDALQSASRWRDAALSGGWERHRFPEMRLTTWLVVGLGAIGRGVTVRAQSFGASVIGCRRRPVGDEPADLVVTPDRLLSELPRADVVVLAASSTKDSAHLVDSAFLAAMREGSVLVNVARASLIDEAALLAALQGGRPALAVLDTFYEEPLPQASSMWHNERIVLTPHNAGAGIGAADSAATEFAAKLAAWIADRSPGDADGR